MLKQVMVWGVFYPILGVFLPLNPFFVWFYVLNRTYPQTALIDIGLRKELRRL